MTRSARLSVAAVLAAALAGCGTAPPGPAIAPESATTPTPGPITVANIKRLGAQLPAGYEQAAADVASPAAIWGLGAAAVADPAGCAALAAPSGDAAAQGISGSGPGGIVYAVVVADHAGAPEAELLSGCADWTVSLAGTVVAVEIIDAPPIEHATTLGLAARRVTRVEGGGEIDSAAYTFTAYLDGYRVVTAVVVDPGSPDPPVEPSFAADLLVTAVAELRGGTRPVG